MPVVVLMAEAAAALFAVLFLMALATTPAPGPLLGTGASDPVSRTLIRAVQAAFGLGYGVFFLFTGLVAANLL